MSSFLYWLALGCTWASLGATVTSFTIGDAMGGLLWLAAMGHSAVGALVMDRFRKMDREIQEMKGAA